MNDKNVLLVEEQALHEQEQGIVQMEAQLHTQEQGVAQMERAFQKKNRVLLNHASFVKEQETSLLRRADAMGSKASQLAAALLDDPETQVGPVDLDLGKLAERQRLLQRRKELMSARMALLEEREALYAARSEVLERAEGQVAELEQKLIRREGAISEAARKVFSAGSELLDDEDEEGDPGHSYVTPYRSREHTPQTGGAALMGEGGQPQAVRSTSFEARAPLARAPAEVFSPAGRPAAEGRDGPEIAGEPVRVMSGEVAQGDGEGEEGIGGVSRAEDKATRKRASARARVRTNQFKITLEANLADEDNHFFRYENDSVDDLPGLFIATPNLLKVGREVRISVRQATQRLEATGIVAWRRQRGDAGGSPGMGIELLNLSDPERALVETWISNKPPVTI